MAHAVITEEYKFQKFIINNYVILHGVRTVTMTLSQY